MGDHTLERCEEVTNIVLDRVFLAFVRCPAIVPRGHGAQAEYGSSPARNAHRRATPEQAAEAHHSDIEAPSAGGGARYRFSCPEARVRPKRRCT